MGDGWVARACRPAGQRLLAAHRVETIPATPLPQTHLSKRANSSASAAVPCPPCWRGVAGRSASPATLATNSAVLLAPTSSSVSSGASVGLAALPGAGAAAAWRCSLSAMAWPGGHRRRRQRLSACRGRRRRRYRSSCCRCSGCALRRTWVARQCLGNAGGGQAAARTRVRALGAKDSEPLHVSSDRRGCGDRDTDTAARAISLLLKATAARCPPRCRDVCGRGCPAPDRAWLAVPHVLSCFQIHLARPRAKHTF